jgi:ferrous iron transport protein A
MKDFECRFHFSLDTRQASLYFLKSIFNFMLFFAGRSLTGPNRQGGSGKQSRETGTMLKLSMRQMKEKQSGVIAAVRTGGELGKRIRDMGLVPGSEIKIQGRAPLYDPVAIRIMGFTLTLRNNEADYIDVTVEDGR